MSKGRKNGLTKFLVNLTSQNVAKTDGAMLLLGQLNLTCYLPFHRQKNSSVSGGSRGSRERSCLFCVRFARAELPAHLFCDGWTHFLSCWSSKGERGKRGIIYSCRIKFGKWFSTSPSSLVSACAAYTTPACACLLELEKFSFEI